MDLMQLKPILFAVILLGLAFPAAFVYLVFIARSSVSLQRLNGEQSTTTQEANRELCVAKELDAPEGWFTDASTFELERRAIFSQARNMLLPTWSVANQCRPGCASPICPIFVAMETT